MAHTERNILLEKLNQAKTLVEIGAIYQHTKTGGRYLVENLGIGENDEEVNVIYKEFNHPGNITWIRSLTGPNGWTTPTEIDGQFVPRFTKIEK
jgi:hypothetical protein